MTIRLFLAPSVLAFLTLHEHVKGAKKLDSGYFADLLFCPYCNKTVPSPIAHLKEVRPITE